MNKPIILASLLSATFAAGPVLAQEQNKDSVDTGAPVVSSELLSAMPSYREPTVAWKTVNDAEIEEAICRDRIHEAREEAGQPPHDREPATGDELMAIWAVDRREDGCSVLVTMGDPEDIRPIPKIEERYALRPAG